MEQWRREVREKRQRETKAVKQALVRGGFPAVSVGHGRGTAWGWIDVSLHEPYNAERFDLARGIVLKASGREERAKQDDPLTDYNASNICVDFRGPRIKKL